MITCTRVWNGSRAPRAGGGVRRLGEECVAPGGQLKRRGHGELQAPVHAGLLVDLVAHLDVDGYRVRGERDGWQDTDTENGQSNPILHRGAILILRQSVAKRNPGRGWLSDD